ncbi:MAG: phosphoribosylanthranilate isomerase [Actinomycetota bacterium]|nr:phosphoribosylanthranilate isomerase [Actinomycetota bacterium]
MVRVKICGITNLDDALMAVEYGADALGFVFATSPRRIEPNVAREIIMELPPFVSKVGVFVDEGAQAVQKIAKECGLDSLQFHGKERAVYCSAFKGAYKVIKAFKVSADFKFETLRGYGVDGVLLDTYVEGRAGGSGLTFDWQIAREVKASSMRPLILSGGLNPQNVAEAIQAAHPFAVDVSSGVEAAPGRKDGPKIEKFIRRAKGRPCD